METARATWRVKLHQKADRVRRLQNLFVSLIVGIGLTFSSNAIANGNPTSAAETDAATALGSSTGKYIIQFPKSVSGSARNILRRVGVDVTKRDMSGLRGKIFDGVVTDLTRRQLMKIRASRLVKRVERNRQIRSPNPVVADATTATPFWNLSRINQRALPLDNIFDPVGTGAGVNIYVIDSGVNLDLNEFAGRVGESAYVSSVADSPYDCQGHGTHVAGIALSTTYGVAKNATIHSVRILDCEGQGTGAGLLQALNWITDKAQRPAIINASFGGPRSQILEAAIAKTVSQGILTVAAAGNDAGDACQQSPASEPSVVSVGASNTNDQEAAFSNFGSCLDLWAPGTQISSLGLLGQETILSGTSMAAPAVSGIAAILWSLYPTADASDISNLVVKSSTPNTLSLDRPGSPNQLAYIERPVPVLPFQTPEKVRKLKPGKKTSSSVMAKWKAPKSDGGAKITKYESRYKTDGKWKSWKSKKAKKLETNKKNQFSWKFKKIKPNKKVKVKVRARNTFGHGPSAKITLRTRSK